MTEPLTRSLIVATPAFIRTRCLHCGHYLRPGQSLVSTADGFRHHGCVVVGR